MRRFRRHLWSVLMIVCFANRTWTQEYRHPLRSAFLSASAGFPPYSNAILVADNPALSNDARKPGICAYAENEYGIRNLNFIKLAANIGNKQSGIGFILSHLGNIDYREVIVGCHYAKSLGTASIGAAFRYDIFHNNRTGSESCFEYLVSTSFKLNEQFFTVLTLSNPWAIRADAKAIAPGYALSFGYAASESAFAEIRLLKEERRDFQASIALHFRCSDRWIFHTGCWPTTFRPFIGIEWQESSFRLLINVSYHPTLGASPGLLVSYEPIQSETE